MIYDFQTLPEWRSQEQHRDLSVILDELRSEAS